MGRDHNYNRLQSSCNGNHKQNFNLIGYLKRNNLSYHTVKPWFQNSQCTYLANYART